MQLWREKFRFVAHHEDGKTKCKSDWFLEGYVQAESKGKLFLEQNSEWLSFEVQKRFFLGEM